jgi:hypothetical protein
MGPGGSVEGNAERFGRMTESCSADELVVGAIDCPLQMRQSNLHLWPLQPLGSDDRLPEEHIKTHNHKNTQDNAPRVATEGLVVVRTQPVGIAHAKLLFRILTPTADNRIKPLKSVRRGPSRSATCQRPS